MPGATPAPAALPYPLAADPPDGPGSFYALATRLTQTYGQDSGWVDLNVASDWQGSGYYMKYRRVGSCMTITGDLQRTTDLTVTAYHAISNTVVPGSLRPTFNLQFVGQIGDGPNTCRVGIDTSGNIGVSTYTTIHTTDPLWFTASYSVGW